MDGRRSLAWLLLTMTGWGAGLTAGVLLTLGRTGWPTLALLAWLALTSLAHIALFQRRFWTTALGVLVSAVLVVGSLAGYWVLGRPLDLLQRGEAARAAGADVEAIDMYTAALGQRPLWSDALLGRAQAYAHQGNLDRAIADLDQVLRLEPGHALAFLKRGNAWADKGNSNRAIWDYSQAILAEPGYADAWNNRGIIYDDQGDYDRAIWDYSQAIRLNPDDSDLYNNRAVSYRGKKDYAQALADYSQAIRLKRAEAARAHANTASSSGSSRMTGSMIAGWITFVRAIYPVTKSSGVTPARRSRLANLSRVRTSSSSTNSWGLVNSWMRRERATSSIWRGPPDHSSPETTVFVSATTRMLTPVSASRVNLCLNLALGQRRHVHGR